MGWSRVRLSRREEDVNRSPAAVKSSPKGGRARRSIWKAGFVPAVFRRESHPHRARGAKTPSHSYHVQVETRKKVRDSRASRAGPRAGLRSKSRGKAVSENRPAAGVSSGCVFLAAKNAAQARKTTPYMAI